MDHYDSQEMYRSVVFPTETDEGLVQAQPVAVLGCAHTTLYTIGTNFKSAHRDVWWLKGFIESWHLE